MQQRQDGALFGAFSQQVFASDSTVGAIEKPLSGVGALKNRPARNLSDWPCSGRSRGQAGSLLGPADGVYSSAGEALLRSEYQGDGIWGRFVRHRRWRCGRADGCRRPWPWCRLNTPDEEEYP
ncbi:uncharacterized protein CIMG_12796 [Coccidioides immitis RS]|uniref:Uncharacterized protein n=1 Tax=Coccidioides immitis (strain RS) TaxID=246410 RepID=A0A0D8JSU9_COCIM|nr:uncharacterized protein CIMG_12796 [Coccidioides immitis RS]KJF60189.1 hypothetical protein CIMG_12796 [Coccidioides immitis RS]